MASDDLTSILSRSFSGDRRAGDALMAAVYDELRDLAEQRLKHERPGHLLQPTALVHEAYLRLVDQTRAGWQGRTHFLAIACQAMRRVLIDHARGRNSEKRGGSWRQVALYDAFALKPDRRLEVLALHEALEKMSRADAQMASAVELRLFSGLTAEEISQQLGISTRTVQREWKIGLAWLRRELGNRD